MAPFKNDDFDFLDKVCILGEFFYFDLVDVIYSFVGGRFQSDGAFDIILSGGQVIFKVSECSTESVDLLESLLVSFERSPVFILR